MKQIVLASSNPGKLREFAQLFAPLGIELIPQSALGIFDADEPHATFVENALAKARHASRAAKLPALADDSGICVRALAGEPGVHSARFAKAATALSTAPAPATAPATAPAPAPATTAADADAAGACGRDSQDAANNRTLLALLRGQPDRAAHYYCAIVLVRHAADPEPLIADGLWHGEIIDTPAGSNGFGYDPYFFLPSLGQTAAELAPAQKNALSHRGKALRLLLARLEEGA